MVKLAKTDVVVIGGGPAGPAAAIAARRAGLAVCLIDRSSSPIDKACGEGLMPDGVAALHDLGVAFHDGQGSPFRGIRFADDRRVAEARFPAEAGIGLRRTQLHRILVEQAEALGVSILWQAKATGLESEGVRIDGGLLPCRWVVGADGVHSRARDWAGLTPSSNGRRRLGLRQHFRVAPRTDMVEVHWARGEQAYVTPVGREEIYASRCSAEWMRPASPISLRAFHDWRKG